MGIGYRALLRFSADDDAVAITEEQFRSWLASKRRRGGRGTLDVTDWDGDGRYAVGRRSQLVVVSADDARDRSRRLLLRLREENKDGVWTVSAYAISAPSSKSHRQVVLIELDVQGADEESAIGKARPPRLVSMILERARAFDGSTVVTPVPFRSTRDDLDDLYSAMLDPQRSLPLVLAVSPGGVPDTRWLEVVADLTRDSVGVATAFTLTPADAQLLNERLPRSHALRLGQVRTFESGVDVEDPSDGFRHRFLNANSFARSIRDGRVRGYLPIAHAQRARRKAVQAELPAEVRRARDLLLREETLVLMRAEIADLTRERRVTDVPAVAHVVADWAQEVRDAIVSLVAKWTGSSRVDTTAIAQLDDALTSSDATRAIAQQRIDAALEEQSRLAREIETLRAEVEEAELVTRIESDEARRFRYEAEALRARLRAAGLHAETLIQPDDAVWDAPSSVEELVLLLDPELSEHPALERIQFTGDLDLATEVDRRDPAGRTAATLWDQIRVLYDYVGARREHGFGGSVHMYLGDDEVIGHKCSLKQHAPGETSAVKNNRKMKRERLLPVPTEVDPSGAVEMLAHFRPSHRDTFATRMYYYDDVAGTGKIYVGYIGRHLTNTKTKNA